MLDQMKEAGLDVLAVGKINDIFAGKGITEFVRTTGNEDGINKTLEYMERDFEGICFVNLVDYDMLYGHRNDVDGYAKALTYFDERLPEILEKMRDEDILMITADHGCDPSTPSTDHSRVYATHSVWPAGQGGNELWHTGYICRYCGNDLRLFFHCTKMCRKEVRRILGRIRLEPL